MDAIRIQNLRCLVDTGFVGIRPITVLVGQNNSGKSTFLRTFPLLRQSVEARSEGPLLWYGQLVDFGSHSDAVFRESHDKSVTLHFKFTLPTNPRSGVAWPRIRDLLLDDVEITTALKVSAGPRDELYPAEVEITLADQRIRLVLDHESQFREFSVNKSDFSDIIRTMRSRPRPRLLPLMPDLENSYRGEPGPFESRLLTEIGRYVHQKTGETTRRELARGFRLGSSAGMLAQMQASTQAGDVWRRRAATWATPDENFGLIRDLVVAMNMAGILLACDDRIEGFARNVSYVAPVRATADRYARLQNLAVDEVDYQGVNLPLVLSSLTEQESRLFQEWTERSFGFSTRARSSGPGHVSLVIREENSEDVFNIADKGFGYSQILPIITQLWLLVFRRGSSRAPFRRITGVPSVFAIEQPELHLHPRLQAMLMDAFIEMVRLAAQDRKLDLRLVLETHSEAMINRLGHRIARRDIDPKDVAVVVFEKPRPDEPTVIKLGEFSEDGFLTNWPFGFFEPDRI